jgi:fructose-specific phosphotransferase system IIC component
MRDTLASLSGKTRLTIMLLLLVATPIIAYTDYVPGFFAGFTGGLLIGLLIGELARYLKRIGRL